MSCLVNFRICLAAAVFVAGRGLAQDVGEAVLAPPALVAPVPDVPPEDQRFAVWVHHYGIAAAARGLDVAVLDNVLNGLRYSARVVELDRNQPDDSAPSPTAFADYLVRRLDPVLIARGNGVKSAMADKLVEIEALTGVPGSIILGIWGMESSYGVNPGDFDVPRSVASLAFDGRRAALFTRELDASVAIIARGMATREQLKGSWAGAMGQPQFLPSSFLNYAADGDGDGRIDIWGSRPDVAASVANYLSKNGWRAGARWGMSVTLSPGFERWRVRNLEAPTECVRPMLRHSRWISIKQWRELGVLTEREWPADDVLATLVEPDGEGGKAYLTFGNYRAIMAYNCSNYYALSVALLGDALD